MSSESGPRAARAASTRGGRFLPQPMTARTEAGERIQAWRAWSGCGDGAQVHLIIDPSARQVWLLEPGEPKTDPRSV